MDHQQADSSNSSCRKIDQPNDKALRTTLSFLLMLSRIANLVRSLTKHDSIESLYPVVNDDKQHCSEDEQVEALAEGKVSTMDSTRLELHDSHSGPSDLKYMFSDTMIESLNAEQGLHMQIQDAGLPLQEFSQGNFFKHFTDAGDMNENADSRAIVLASTVTQDGSHISRAQAITQKLRIKTTLHRQFIVEDVNRKADDFIKNFRKQLRFERAASLKCYQETTAQRSKQV